MLQKTSTHVVNGRASEPDCDAPISEKERVSVLAASQAKGCIVIQEFRESALFGMATGGGWSLLGGRLDGMPLDSSTLELYGTRILRYEPGLFDNKAAAEDSSYRFYLVRRDEQRQSTVMREWDLSFDRIYGTGAQYTKEHFLSNIGGNLSESEKTGDMVVELHGMSPPIKETFSPDSIGVSQRAN